MDPHALTALIRRHVEAENRHDLSATLATLHPQCEFTDFGMGRTFRGLDGARAHYELWWRGFELRVEGERGFVDGSTFVAETRFHGRHHGEFLGVPASGREIELHVAVVVEVRDGLMASERFYYDMRGLLLQLGRRPE
jgi:steroid delta-isomerase-like uncharacterized protein